MTAIVNSDTNTTLSELKAEIHQFIQDRNWAKYHTPKNLGMSIAIEAAEIMEHFQWQTSEGSQNLIKEPRVKQLVADELADVLVYCLAMANQADIDISSAVRSKMARNQKRFPVGYMPTKEE